MRAAAGFELFRGLLSVYSEGAAIKVHVEVLTGKDQS